MSDRVIAARGLTKDYGGGKGILASWAPTARAKPPPSAC